MHCGELQLPAQPGAAAGSWGKPSCAWAALLPALNMGQTRGWLSPALLRAQQRSLEGSPAPLVQVTTCHLTPLESCCSSPGS